MKLVRLCVAMAISAFALLWFGGVAAEPVTFTKDAALRSAPRADAAPAAQIKKGTVGDASGKQGPWLNIKTPQASGWALTTDISFGSGSGGAASGGASLGGIFGGGRQQVSGTSTLGVRGFDKETIGTALGEGGAVSTAQLALLDGYAVSKEDGQSFASGKGLSASSVAY
jgi:hypothetical protein